MKSFNFRFFLSLALTGLAGCAKAQIAAPKPVAASGWQPVPLITAAQKADPSVQIGGEGGQWPRALAWSRDAKLAIWGTDVGGLYRSLNGGQSWEPCNVGYTPRGTAGLAIDPGNSRRVLSVGANSATSDYHGIWVSEDGAASWKSALSVNISGSQDNREQLAFDPASYDAAQKLTRTVYWSRIADDDKQTDKSKVHPALYKSGDGGRTWAELEGSAWAGGSLVKVHPTQSVVYIGNAQGLSRSSDGGATWTQTLKGELTGLDVSAAAPNYVWVSMADGVYSSNNAGKTWSKLAGSTVLAREKAPLRNVHVAPTDATRMVIWREGADYEWTRFYSTDAGATWKESRIDVTLSFLPTNARQGLWAWNPTNANQLLCTGGDYPTLSTDGGATYRWTGDGVNAILVGGAFHFNAQNPDVLFVGSQDYNGASTQDGGKTWTYRNPSGQSWGGFTYGGYAASDKVMVVGDSPYWGGEREVTVTRDGGQTWNKTGHKFQWAETSLGAPDDANVIFIGDWRSADGGQSWAQMEGCTRVYATDAKGDLWGNWWKENAIVTSSDNGANWRVVTVKDKISDLAIAPDGQKLWAVADGALWKCENLDALTKWSKVTSLAPDQWGAPRVRSVAVDPTDANILYIATNRDLIASSASAQRSLDGGVTWENLTRQTPLDSDIRGGKDGGREAIWVRVHPQTREAWFATSCYGIWKYSALGPEKP